MVLGHRGSFVFYSVVISFIIVDLYFENFFCFQRLYFVKVLDVTQKFRDRLLFF